MGLNIAIQKNGVDHPEWDSSRFAGDREFPSFMRGLPQIVKTSLGSEDPEYRPGDFAAWRAAIASREWPNPGRFEKMMDLLEQNPDYWLYFGV